MTMKSIKYSIEGKEYYFRPNARAQIEYEKLAGRPMSEATETATDSLLISYAGTIAGMEKEGLPFNLTFDEYVNLIDMSFDELEQLFITTINEGTEKKKK